VLRARNACGSERSQYAGRSTQYRRFHLDLFSFTESFLASSASNRAR
jgi:hypothetical protein